MKLNDFNPSFDDLISGARILYGAGDVWKDGADGVPHRHIARDGSKLTMYIPDVVPMKYKGRKLSSVCIWCDACENVTNIETHYGNGGRVLNIRPDGPGVYVRDITDVYRAARKSAGRVR